VPKLLTRRARVAVVGLLATTLVSVPATAWAGFGTDPTGSVPNPASIESRITLTASDVGAGAKHLSSIGGSWDPPSCWYEPAYTPEQFDAAWQTLLAGLSGSFKSDAQKQYDELKANQDFHRGQDGLWWVMVKAKKAWDLPVTSTCTQSAGARWVQTGNPPAGLLTVTPQMLSKLAYAATKLPPPSVKLSPAPDRQVVNLPTYVSFDRPLSPVSVTASLDYAGITVAASTLAVPTALRVNAGTDEASPSSCTYTFSKGNDGTYRVDSSTADCNITYQRSSRGATYPLTAEVTWKVTWTPSSDPYGAPANPLPNGLTGGTPQDVIVKEIQTIVTG